MMRWHGPALALLAAVLALLASCAAQPDLPPPSPALWEVTGEDGRKGWLFGTVHALPDGYDWRTDTLDNAFDAADSLVIEADLEQADSRLYRELATTAGLGPPSERVEPVLRAQLAAAFAEAGLPEDSFVDMESWAVALTLASAFRPGKSSNGVDLALARTRGEKPLVELEGYAAQLSIFDRLPVSEQLDMLQIVAAEAGQATTEGDRQALAWRAGEVETLEAALDKGLLADPELREALLVRRNREWADRIDLLLREDGSRPFIAVGAAHLPGDEGLVALLRARGYTVTRIQ